MNLAACGGLPRTPENGTWYRAINPAFLPTALQSSHTRTVYTRFNAGPLLPGAAQYEILYFADDPITAMYEVDAVFGPPGSAIANPLANYVVLNVQIILSDVCDLTDVHHAQVPLATTAQELTGDFDGYQLRGPGKRIVAPTGIAPTQELGRSLLATGAEGFRSISAKLSNNRTLMIFPQNLRAGSRITYRDSRTGAILHEITPP